MVVPSSDYTYPPIDGSIPPALIIDFHLEHNPNQVFTILHDVENSTQTEITYEQLAHAVHRTAHILNPNGAIPQGTNIGFLLSTNTIEYLIAVMGAMRAGLVPFPVSPRTHVAGIAHLFTTTQTKHIAAGGSKAIDDVTLQLGEAFSSSGFDANFIRLPTLEEVLPLGESKVQAQHVPFAPLQPCGNDSIVTILHSSGSTGMPRPIPCHLEGIFKNLISQPVGWVYTGDRVGTMALPTFHIMGMMLQIVLPLYIGYTQVIFAPGKIPVMPTPDLTIKTIASTKCQFTIIVPLFLEAWARDESAIAHLREMKGVMFGGGTLAEVTGNKLVSQGVRMHSCYGGTEFGIVNVIRDQVNLDEWGYVQLSPRVNVFFDPQHDSDGTHEVVFVETGEHKPFVINSEVDGKPAYRTKDLVVRHPVKPDLWKFLGRLDDQIVLLNGEKTNPAPMEAEIVKSPLVRDAVMFGRERKQTGVLIELAPNVNSSSLADEDRTKLVEGIWPHVERANQVSSTHSRLDKSTIVVADPTRPLPRTPKATVSRSAALKLYAKEIEDMYASLEGDSGLTNIVEPPESWSELGIVEAWVGKCVSNILGRDVDPVGDLFQQGMDSLTATILLRTIKGALHKSPDPTTQAAAKQINQQTIFAKPTVQQLATVLVHLFTDVNDDMDPVAEALQSMRAIVDKYNSNWARTRVHSASAQSVQKECVVVTGTTGGLGSHLLAQLLANDKVNRVWALNRKSAKLNQTRQEAAFEDKLLDGELLNSTKLIMLDTDLEDAKLGLSDELYDEIRGRATIIVHNAWQVNFNLSLQSFEPSIRGARNLLDLAFSSTATTGMPRFVFTSSVSVVGLGGPEKVLREVPVKLEDGTRSIGYGQSKLVTEKLLESAREAGLQTCAIRLGQLAGDVKSGAWATTDWVPSVIASSVSVGCLPAAVGTVSWLPLDTAARSVIDVCASRSAPLPLVIHSSHPRPVPWMDIMTALSEALATRGSLRLVRFDEWNKRVTGSAAAFKGPESERYKRFPSTKIQSTVDTMVLADEKLRSQVEVGDAEACGTVRLDTAGGERLSKALKTENHIGREHVGKWVEYWAKKGLFV